MDHVDKKNYLTTVLLLSLVAILDFQISLFDTSMQVNLYASTNLLQHPVF